MLNSRITSKIVGFPRQNARSVFESSRFSSRLYMTDSEPIKPARRTLTSRLFRGIGWIGFLGGAGYAFAYILDQTNSNVPKDPKLVLSGQKRGEYRPVVAEESLVDKAKETLEHAEEVVIHAVELATGKVMEAVDGVTNKEPKKEVSKPKMSASAWKKPATPATTKPIDKEVERIVEAVQDDVPDLSGASLSGLAAVAGDKIKSVVDKAKDVVQDLADDGIINHSNKTGITAKPSPVPEVTDGISKESKVAMKNLAEDVKEKAKEALNKAKDIVQDLADDGIINQSNKTGITTKSSPAPEVTDGISKESKVAMKNLADDIKQKAQNALAKAKDMVEDAKEVVKDLADDGKLNQSTKTGKVEPTFENASAKIHNVAEDVKQTAQDVVQKARDLVPGNLLDSVKEKVHDVTVAATNVVQDLKDDGKLNHSIHVVSNPADVPEIEAWEKLVKLGAEKVEPFDEIPVAIRLNRTITSLDPLLTSLASSYTGKNRKTILEAQVELQRLSRQLDALEAEEMTLIRAALDDQAEKFADVIKSQETQAAEALQKSQEALTRRFQAQIKELDEKIARLQTSDFSRSIEEEAIDLAAALKAKADDYVAEREQYWMDVAQKTVAKERADRLAKLDWLMLKAKSLETATVEASGNAHRMYTLNRLWTSVRALERATRNGSTPFAKELENVKQFGEHWPLVQAAISTIPPTVASQGVLSESQLAQWWRDSVRLKVKRASLMPDEGGLVSHAASWLLSHFMLDKKGLIPGDDIDAILARSDYYLNRGDLDNAAREINQLHGWTKTLAHDWLTEARKTLAVRQMCEVLEAELSLRACEATDRT